MVIFSPQWTYCKLTAGRPEQGLFRFLLLRENCMALNGIQFRYFQGGNYMISIEGLAIIVLVVVLVIRLEKKK